MFLLFASRPIHTPLPKRLMYWPVISHTCPPPPHTHKAFPSGDSGPRPHQARATAWPHCSLRRPWGPSLEPVGPTGKRTPAIQWGFPARCEGAAGLPGKSPAAPQGGLCSSLPRCAAQAGARKRNHVRPARGKLAEGTVHSCLEVPGEGALHSKVATGLSPIR